MQSPAGYFDGVSLCDAKSGESDLEGRCTVGVGVEQGDGRDVRGVELCLYWGRVGLA